jgi:type IV secretory pathway component VirB8
MTTTEHLTFLVLMVPTFVILAAAAVSMADLTLPAGRHEPYVVAIDPATFTYADWDGPVQ